MPGYYYSHTSSSPKSYMLEKITKSSSKTHNTQVTVKAWWYNDTTIRYTISIANDTNDTKDCNHKSAVFVIATEKTSGIVHKLFVTRYSDKSDLANGFGKYDQTTEFPCKDNSSFGTTSSPKSFTVTALSGQDTEIIFKVYTTCYGFGAPGLSWSQPTSGSCKVDNYTSDRVAEGSFSIIRYYYTDPTISAPTIKDNENNSYTVTFSNGTSGTHNAISSHTFEYYDIPTGTSVATTSASKTITFTPTVGTTVNSVQVTASSTATGAYSSTTKSTSANIKQYPAPGDVEGLEILANGSSGKYVLTKPVTVQWNNVTKTNNNMIIDSYRVYFVKNGTTINVNGKKITANGSTITGVSDGTWHYFTVPKSSSNPNSIEFNPKDFGLAKDDKFSIGIYTHSTSTKVGEFSNGKFFGPVTFVNAGIVHMYDGSTWKEGQVFVYDGSTWKEAEVVSVYDGSTWREAT